MKSIEKHFFYFLIPYAIVLLGMLFLLFTTSKADLHLQMNAYHTDFGDVFFKYFTEIGGGTYPFILIALLLFYRYSHVVYLLVAQLVGGTISFFAKRGFAEPRPFDYFQKFFPSVELPLVEGVKIYHSCSFPSGHTITAFALFGGIALMLRNKWASLACVTLAIMTAYSRVYLSQHFAIDIVVGSVIGTAMAWLFYPMLLKLDKKWGKHSLCDFCKK